MLKKNAIEQKLSRGLRQKHLYETEIPQVLPNQQPSRFVAQRARVCEWSSCSNQFKSAIAGRPYPIEFLISARGSQQINTGQEASQRAVAPASSRVRHGQPSRRSSAQMAALWTSVRSCSINAALNLIRRRGFRSIPIPAACLI